MQLSMNRLGMLFVVLALVAGIITMTAPASSAADASEPNSLSLARAFPSETLAEILLPRDQWHPFPALKERERWEELAKPVTNRLLVLGEASLNKTFPSLPATLYLGYARTG